MRKLLPRQRQFVELLVLHNLSATRAAQQAGYAQHDRSAQVVACRLLARYPHVREYLRQRASKVHGQAYQDAADALKAVRLMSESAAWMQRMQRECSGAW
jgi:phage terminase small subunit